MEDMSLVLHSGDPLIGYSHVADEEAQRGRLHAYQKTLTHQTLRRHRGDIAVFQQYILSETQISISNLYENIIEWQFVTWGVVERFRDWQLAQGYAHTTVDVRIATVKCYCRIAFESGILPDSSWIRIHSLRKYSSVQARNIDEQRPVTRRSTKKEKPTPISLTHIRALREKLEQDSSYIGCRDLLLLCLLGYQGLRCGEVASLETKNIDLSEASFFIYRHKVDKLQLHTMHHATLLAMQKYMSIARLGVKLFEGVDRDEWVDRSGKVYAGSCASDGLSTDAIYVRVRKLGESVGIKKLSPHDLRHYWTKDAFKNGSALDVVQEAGGWSTPLLPMLYRGEMRVANEGIKQSQ